MAAPKKFKVGDVVRLASGSPKLTVAIGIEKAGYVQCAWFDGPELKTGDLPEDALVKDDGKE
jgi:uncharacterized protein YodC (DUF2158 family)